jgi:hypothetical protein
MVFMDQVWRNLRCGEGHVGFLHPTTYLTDPKGARLRKAAYERLRRYWSINNAMMLFEETSYWSEYGIQIFGPAQRPSFMMMAGLVHPDTILPSLSHDGSGETPAIQHAVGGWDTRPHSRRVLNIDEDVLASWARLFDAPGTPALEARLLRPVTTDDLDALRVLAEQPVRLAYHDYHWTAGFHEKGAKEAGIIEWDTRIPDSWHEVILQGPQFTVATPFAKQPNERCKHNQDYTAWDLESLPESVVPRTNYQRSCTRDRYRGAVDTWNGRRSTLLWRVVWRRMTQPGLERSIQPAIIPPGPAYVDTVTGIAYANLVELGVTAGVLSSIPSDYLAKVSGRADLRDEFMRGLPVPRESPLDAAVLLRTLRLNCLTREYAPLWEELFDRAWLDEAWVDALPTQRPLEDINPGWTMATPLRTDLDRRKALVELDALVALMLGLSADQLCAMYRTQFAVLRKYEFNMLFDANGRKIAKDHQTAGVRQKKGDWELVNQWIENPGSVDLGQYEAPFFKPDREKEMRVAYEEFARRHHLEAPQVDGAATGAEVASA